MTEELFDKAVEEGNPVCYYLFKDLGIDKGCKYFVETGTFEGYSVQVALDHGYEEVFSCELFPERYGKCLERFEDNDNVNLWLGDSDDAFGEMMSKVDKKSCFWLDAHGEGGGVPTFNELEEIAKNPIKDHTIIIDDVPEYFKGADKFRLEKELLAINPDYKLQYYKSINRTDDYVLAAYIE